MNNKQNIIALLTLEPKNIKNLVIFIGKYLNKTEKHEIYMYVNNQIKNNHIRNGEYCFRLLLSEIILNWVLNISYKGDLSCEIMFKDY